MDILKLRADDYLENEEAFRIARFVWSARGSQARVISLMFRCRTIEQLWAQYGDDLGARFFRSPQGQPETLRLDQILHLNLIDEFNYHMG